MDVLPTLTLQPSRRRQINVFRPHRQRNGNLSSRGTHCHRRARTSKSFCASCISFPAAVPLCLTIALRCQTAVLVCYDTVLTQCRPLLLSLPQLFRSLIAILVYASSEDQFDPKSLGWDRACGNRAGKARGRAVIHLQRSRRPRHQLMARGLRIDAPTSLQSPYLRT